MRAVPITIGIAAYNEEQNIGRLFDAILAQRLTPNIAIKEILVVASGCTDQTIPIVRARAKRDSRIRLMTERVRRGKVTAVNKILRTATGKFIVLISADTIPEKHAFARLLKPFFRKKTLKKMDSGQDSGQAGTSVAGVTKITSQQNDVGMTGGRPIPVDDKETFLGFVNHLQWELHHTLCLEHPKCGEMVAFRNLRQSVILASEARARPGSQSEREGLRTSRSDKKSSRNDTIQIPPDNVHDEAYLEMFFRSRNYRVVYVPRAIVYNKGPDTIAEFVRRRRNITAGFVQLWVRYNYKPGTAVSVRQALAFIWMMMKKHPGKTHWIFAGAGLQHLAATLGSRDYEKGIKNPHIWEVTRSSKKLTMRRKIS